ncbi:MAG: hypothetical protein ACRC2K_06390 [Clostridium sp.]
MIRELGELLGWGVFIFYGIAILNYIVKFANKNFKDIINKNEKIRDIYNWAMKIIIKYHKYFGGVTLIVLLSHFLIQFSYRGIKTTGLIAAILLILEFILGAIGVYKKKRSGLWFYMHRFISVVLLIAIILHVL